MTRKTDEERKKEILKILKDFGMLPIYRISGILATNQPVVIKLLNELIEEDKIKTLSVPAGTYYQLK